MGTDLELARRMSGKVAVVGVGETDYASDYRGPDGATRRRGATGAHDSYGLAAIAFSRALAESGLDKSEIDGVIVSGSIRSEVTCELLGLQPTWGSTLSGGVDAIVPLAVMGIMAGQCKTVALIMGNNQRSTNLQYGGNTQPGGGAARLHRLGEDYYHTWGFSSPGAQHAMMWQHYMDVYGRREEELYVVPSNSRRHAQRNPNAVMNGRAMDFETWWNSAYIAKPLRMMDYCMINDGGTCIILRRADLCAELPHNDVVVSGFSWETVAHSSQLKDRVGDNYYAKTKAAADSCYAMGGVTAKDISHFQVYDGFSDILVWATEAFGFCGRGEALDFMGKNGETLDIDGALPCMTSGGLHSESYLHGWNHQVEAIRQLRGGLGERQVKDANVSVYVHPGGEGPHTVMYRRAD